jgi:serine O-acetyltransferase
MFELFKQDVRRWIRPQQIADPSEVTLWRTLRLLITYMPLRAMLWFRLGSWFKQRRVPLLPGAIQRYIYRHFGLEISPGADIGGGLYIAHPVGTVIAVKRMGRNCSIIAAVTLGMRNTWEFPEIGDNVLIGAGARVLGNVCLGDGALIGANAVVIHDVPAGATAVGIPARIKEVAGKPAANGDLAWLKSPLQIDDRPQATDGGSPEERPSSTVHRPPSANYQAPLPESGEPIAGSQMTVEG